MALEEILKKIKEETDGKLTEINSRIKKRVEEIMQEGEKNAVELRETLFKEAKEKIIEERNSKLATARLDFRKKLLQEKHRVLQETFRRAFEDIRNLDDNDYKKFIRGIILEVAGADEGEIFISGRDRKKIDPSLIEEINKTLKRQDKSATLKLSQEDANIDGGFILKMGQVEMNCSLSSLFKKEREELESEVSAILLKNGR